MRQVVSGTTFRAYCCQRVGSHPLSLLRNIYLSNPIVSSFFILLTARR